MRRISRLGRSVRHLIALALSLQFGATGAVGAAPACAGPDEVQSEKYGSFIGTIKQIAIFGHRPKNVETLVWMADQANTAKLFAIWADTDPRIYPSLVSAALDARRSGEAVEVCFCAHPTSAAAKIVQINFGYDRPVCQEKSG